MGQQTSPRFPITYPISLLYSERTRLPGAQPRVRLKGQTHDLSNEGMGIEVIHHHGLNTGQDVTILLHYGDIADTRETLSLFGKIIWSHNGRIGLKLLQMNVPTESPYASPKPSESRSFYYSLIEGFQSLNGLEPIGHLEFDS